MTRQEFLERKESEKLYIPGKNIQLGGGISIPDSDSYIIVGCSQITKDTEWFIYESRIYFILELEFYSPFYVTVTDKRGKTREVPISPGADILISYEKEEDALDYFYLAIVQDAKKLQRK